MKRMVLTIAAAAALAVRPAPPVEAAEAGWCGLYCDAIYVGCKKTIGWLDRDACDEWHDGCLDGCKAATE